MKLLFEHDNQERWIDVPFHPAEITFEQFCDFRQKEASVDEETPPEEYLVNKRDSVKILVKGDVDCLPPSIKGDDVIQMIGEDHRYKIRIGDELSIVRVYAHIINVIQEWKPEKIPQTFQFTAGKNKFIIRSEEAARVMLDAPITTGEVIETLEYQRRASALMESKPKDIGNIDFNLGLSELSVLVRKEGEELPAKRKDRDKFIERRKRIFRNVPLDTILAIRFFFLNSLLDYGKTLGSSSSGREVLKAKKERRRKRKGISISELRKQERW